MLKKEEQEERNKLLDCQLSLSLLVISYHFLKSSPSHKKIDDFYRLEEGKI
jgi:hypothetical protein